MSDTNKDKERTDAILRGIADGINDIVNPKGKKWGFFVGLFPLDYRKEDRRFNYISNCRRADIVLLLREMAAKFEKDVSPETEAVYIEAEGES